MLNGEAAVGVIYSGELLYLQEEAETLDLDYDLEYVIPEEGTNIWIDSWVIPDNAKNKENAGEVDRLPLPSGYRGEEFRVHYLCDTESRRLLISWIRNIRKTRRYSRIRISLRIPRYTVISEPRQMICTTRCGRKLSRSK